METQLFLCTRDESLIAIKRAGADMILTYFAAEVAAEM
jgi:delta-aminolevulinic acid dehydratase/porphobilinogen synthase